LQKIASTRVFRPPLAAIKPYLQRREVHRRVRFAAWFIICAGDRVKKVPERELVQHAILQRITGLIAAEGVPMRGVQEALGYFRAAGYKTSAAS
jgi:hypothetical protein